MRPILFRSSTLCLLLVVGALAVGTAGCARPGDRCWVRPDRHEQARRLYERSGSIELVAQTLREADWLECEINETVVRLAKENSL